MTVTPLVSVIVPTYNREQFLEKAIQSVLSQTYQNFELIIVDDGSTDNTNALVEKYKQDKRVHYYYQENQRQSAARNLALRHAKGDFICFLDSDNYWPEDRLMKSVNAFNDNPSVHIVYGDCITINEEGIEVSRANMRRHSGRITAHLLKDNCVSMNTTTTRRECFDEMGGMSGKRRVADDYDLWLRFSSQYQFLYIPEYLAYYRVMPDQISSNKTLRFDTNEKIIKDFLKEYPEAVTISEANIGWAHFYSRKSRYLLSVNQKKHAIVAATKAIAYRPHALIGWRSLIRVFLRKGP